MSSRPNRDLNLPKSALERVANKLGCAFSTVNKAYQAKSKNWRNCTVRGKRIRDELRKEL